MSLKELLLELAKENFWSDFLSIDKTLINQKTCPKCKVRFLEYRGFAIASEYRAYGVCTACDFAWLFSREVSGVSMTKFVGVV